MFKGGEKADGKPEEKDPGEDQGRCDDKLYPGGEISSIGRAGRNDKADIDPVQNNP